MSDLYQAVILDHFKKPRGREAFERTEALGGEWIECRNPACGDVVRLRLAMDETDTQARFQAQACAIAVASASLLTEAVAGVESEADLRSALAMARRIIQGEDGEELKRFEELEALGAVADFPLRQSCAGLAWDALEEALDALESSR